MKKRTIIIILAVIIVICIICGLYTNANSLENKEIAFLGDSIMSGYGNDDKSFDYYMKSYIEGGKFVNNSRGGSTITENTGNDEIVIKKQVESLGGNPDLIVFNGGVNDIIGYGLGFLSNDKKLEIGVVDEKTLEVSDRNTVLGNFEDTLNTMKEKFPQAKICYASILLIDEEMLGNITVDESKKPDIRERRDAFFKGAELLCKKHGVYYADLTHLFVDHNEQYRQSDWIHMSAVGYEKVTPFLYKHIKNIKFPLF